MPKSPDEEFNPEEFVLRKIEEIPGVDVIILSLGAFLGLQGWTPLTALINIAKGFDVAAGQTLPGGAPAWIAGGPIGIIVAWLLGGSQGAKETPEQLQSKIAKAALGALEAYALTRPGTVGGILQGIGEIVPL